MNMTLLNECKNNSAKKYAVALAGDAQRGKTTSLKLLVNHLRDLKMPIVAMQSLPNQIDEMWCFDVEGIRVGVATGGDDDEIVRKEFDFFKLHACRVVFIATRYKVDQSSWSEFENQCKAKGFDYQTHWVNGRTIPESAYGVINESRESELFGKLFS